MRANLVFALTAAVLLLASLPALQGVSDLAGPTAAEPREASEAQAPDVRPRAPERGPAATRAPLAQLDFARRTVTDLVIPPAGGTVVVQETALVLGADSGEPSVAANGRDPRNIVFTANGETAFYSTDGGATWTQAAPMESLGDQTLSFDGDGRAIAGTIKDYYNTGFAVSTDGGATFGQLAVAQGPTTGFLFPDGGVRTPCSTQNVPFYYDFPKLAADPHSQRLFLVAQSLFDANDNGACEDWENQKTYIWSPDGGATWQDAQVLTTPSRHENIAVAADGAVLLADVADGQQCGLALWKSRDGRSFTETCASGLLPQQTWIASHPTNAGVHAVAFNMPVEGGVLPLFVITTHDGGATWSPPKRVDDPLAPPAFVRQFPTLAIAPNGRLDVAWVDSRDAIQDEDADVYYSFSDDDGRTWAPNVRLTASTAPFHMAGNDYITIASTDDAAFVAYAQARSGLGRLDWYVAKVTHPP